MTIKFTKLTRGNMRNLKTGAMLNEHGIKFERLANGDGRYTVNIMVEGKRIHRVVGKESDGTTRTQAEEFIEKIKQDAKTGRLNLPKGRKIALGFSEAIDDYLKKLEQEGGKDIIKKRYRLNQHLKPFFTETPLSKIISSDVERYKKERLAKNAKPGTINRELAALSHLLNQAIEWKWLDHKPCQIKRLKEDNSRITYLTIEQVQQLLEAAKQDACAILYPFILIALATSMRKTEILSIQIKNIDLPRLVIYIPIAKGGAREQPITQYLASFLKDYLAKIPSDQTWLFPANSASGHAISIEKPFRRVVTQIGLDPKQVVRHTLRHTAITHLVQSKMDLPTVQRVSGHKTLQMVMRYSHQNGEHIRAAMNALEQRYNLTDIGTQNAPAN